MDRSKAPEANTLEWQLITMDRWVAEERRNSWSASNHRLEMDRNSLTMHGWGGSKVADPDTDGGRMRAGISLIGAQEGGGDQANRG